jgi:hypothetical protein
MRATEIRALGEVAGEGVTVLHDIVRGVHTGIASRVFTSVGPAARPVEVIHDVIAQAVHTAIGTAGQRLPEAVGALAWIHRIWAPTSRRASTPRRGRWPGYAKHALWHGL